MPWVPDPNGSGMETWQPVELPRDVLNRLLDCLRTPADRREAGADSLQMLFTLAPSWHSWDLAEQKRQQTRKKLARVSKAAAALRSALSKLDHNEGGRLGLRDYRRERFGEVADEGVWRFQMTELVEVHGGRYEGTARNEVFRAVAERIYAASTDQPKRAARRPSKSLDSPLSVALDHFISALYWHEHDVGWQVEVTPQDGTGTLVSFLRIAAPHLPDGFIPPELLTSNRAGFFEGLKRLQRLGTKASQARRTGQKPQAK